MSQFFQHINNSFAVGPMPFQFVALLFGLSSAPQVLAKVLAPFGFLTALSRRYHFEMSERPTAQRIVCMGFGKHRPDCPDLAGVCLVPES